MQVSESAYLEGIIEYIDNAPLFVEKFFGVKPDKWQIEALRALPVKKRVAIRSGHGVGKTALEAWAAWWFLSTRPFPKVPCTAPTQQQLFDVLWPEMAKWLDRSPVLKQFFEWQRTRLVFKKAPERWFATARTSNKPENLAGFHEDHIMFLVDEASGVADEIYETIEGALTTDDALLLMCGNPTKTTGVFHDAFFRDREFYYAMRVSCLDSPRVKKEYAERFARKYHVDSDIYRVRVLGEFPKGEPDTFITLDLIEAAVMCDLKPEPDDILQLGCDVARFGDDETVIASRIGVKLLDLSCYSKKTIPETAGLCLRTALLALDKYHKSSCKIAVDDDGVGGGVTDILRDMVKQNEYPIEIVACHNGGIPSMAGKPHYENWGTESWAHVRDMLVDGTIQLIDDEDLIGQLSTRKYSITPRGKVALESKRDMKKRGLRSPDRADAVVLAFSEARSASVVVGEPVTSSYDDLTDSGYFDEMTSNGFFEKLN